MLYRFVHGRRISIFCALYFIAMVAGCGGYPRPPMQPSSDDGFEGATVEVPPGVENDVPPPDVLAPGDVVDLQIVSDDTSERRSLIIGSNGTIPVSPIGHVRVAGKSLEQASDEVKKALQVVDRFATPNLVLVRSDGRRVTVIGSVEKSGVFSVTPGLRVVDVLALSGGPKMLSFNGDMFMDADLAAARIVRGGKPLPVSLARAMQGDPRHNVYVYPGDLYWVPSVSGQRVSVLGEVGRPASLRYRRGMRLTEALASAGGATKDADNADVRIIRGPLSRPKVYRASLEDIVDGKTTDVELAPGDVIFVTEHWFASTTDVLQRLTPLLIAIGLATAFAN